MLFMKKVAGTIQTIAHVFFFETTIVHEVLLLHAQFISHFVMETIKKCILKSWDLLKIMIISFIEDS